MLDAGAAARGMPLGTDLATRFRRGMRDMVWWLVVPAIKILTIGVGEPNEYLVWQPSRF